MSERLELIVRATYADLERRKQAIPQREVELRASSGPEPRGFRAALSRPGIALIAEHKRRSPSAGVIRAGADIAAVARAYERGGAAALSVLTERDHFDGSLEDLAQSRAATSVPVLRKDFTVDAYQVYEARAWGADAILLVVGALPADRLRALMEVAASVSLDAIVEVHDERELDSALTADATLIGVNNRNLEDFSVDLERTFELRERIPRDRTVVSESGIATHAHVERLGAAGVDAVLVGETLMRAEDPAAACRSLLG